MPDIDPQAFAALTFDCYGTLIDWDRGVAESGARLGSLAGCDHARLVRDRERAEREIELGPYRPYSEVVARSLVRAAAEQGIEASEADGYALAESVGAWPPFDESRGALKRLGGRYRLALLSNIERPTLERSVALLGARFDALVTADAVRSYKPASAHWQAGLEALGLERDAVLHCAQSYYHDVRPACELGFAVAWVNRHSEPIPEGGPVPALHVTSLSELADRLGC